MRWTTALGLPEPRHQCGTLDLDSGVRERFGEQGVLLRAGNVAATVNAGSDGMSERGSFSGFARLHFDAKSPRGSRGFESNLNFGSKGSKTMDYRIEAKPAFCLTGPWIRVRALAKEQGCRESPVF